LRRELDFFFDPRDFDEDEERRERELRVDEERLELLLRPLLDFFPADFLPLDFLLADLRPLFLAGILFSLYIAPAIAVEARHSCSRAEYTFSVRG
jgi:hypothetical protein